RQCATNCGGTGKGLRFAGKSNYERKDPVLLRFLRLQTDLESDPRARDSRLSSGSWANARTRRAMPVGIETLCRTEFLSAMLLSDQPSEMTPSGALNDAADHVAAQRASARIARSRLTRDLVPSRPRVVTR